MTTAFNIVRFRVKPGREQAFIDAHRRADFTAKGFRRASLVKTGEHTFCIVGEWESFDALSQARPMMISVLDSFRADLEDLGGGLGVTDPVSGELVLSLP
jgi:quinol monooxygenase YgiN